MRFGSVALVNLSDAAKSGFTSDPSIPAYEGRIAVLARFETAPAAGHLSNAGLSVEGYLADGVYLLQVPKVSALSLLREVGASEIGLVSPEHKMPTGLWQSGKDDRSGQSVQVIASLAAGANPDEMVATLRRMPEIRDVEAGTGYHYVLAELERSNLERLASLPFVLFVAEWSRSYTIDANWPAGPDYDDLHQRGDFHRTSSRANVLASPASGSAGLSGEGVVVGVGDLQYLGNTHLDLAGRHTVFARPSWCTSCDGEHAIHTSGTIGGAGTRIPRFAGIAPGSTVYSAVFEEVFDYGIQAAEPMVISSNSWNTSDPEVRGWYEEKGQYNVHSQTIDRLLIEQPELLSLHSAGNSGGTQDGYPDSYLLINPSYGSSKNGLVVGGYVGPNSQRAYASFGPTRDGRIKPDIAAVIDVVATVVNNGYALRSGSSMSTPTVAGVGALLYEQFRAKHGSTPEGALIKAVLLNTADYRDGYGPAFDTGFGTVNARRAGQVIEGAQHVSGSIGAGETQSIDIAVPASVDGRPVSQLKVMLYWHDPAALPYATSALVNDLDLQVGGVLPWVLNPSPQNVADPATRGEDHLNNVEQVLIDAPVAGNLQAEISGAGVTMGPQRFHLVYSYILDELTLTWPLGGEALFAGETRDVFWDSHEKGPDREPDGVEYSLDGGTTWDSPEAPPQIYREPGTAVIWQLPSTPLTEALVRVRKGGLTSTSGAFTISDPLTLTNTSGGLAWNSVAGADSYELYRFDERGGRTLEVATSDTSAAISPQSLTDRSTWFTARAVGGGGAIHSGFSEASQLVTTNTPPNAQADSGGGPAGRFIHIDVTANDDDPDGDALFVASVSEPSNGRSFVGGDGATVSYLPDDRFVGTDQFDYTVSDGFLGSASATVTVEVYILASPSLVTPADGAASTEPVTLSWNAVPNATAYRIEVGQVPDLVGAALDRRLQQEETTVELTGLQQGTVYHWRVAASGDGALGDWSPTRSFQVASGVAVEGGSDVPTEFGLAEPHPNPFSGSLTLTVEVPEPSTVSVRAFDILGREVSMLLDAQLVPGRHPTTWSPERLAPGLYLIRMNAEGFEKVIPVVLVR